MTYIDTDHDVIPAVVERPATDALSSLIEVDDYLAARQTWALEQNVTATTEGLRSMLATVHGEATDLRQRIAAAIEAEREDAARVAEEERFDPSDGASHDPVAD